jgi:hypothetical protein
MVPRTDQRVDLATQTDLATIVAVIAHSQIAIAEIVVAALAGRVERPLGGSRNMPAGFEETDIAILDWIAAEGRRARRSYLPM